MHIIKIYEDENGKSDIREYIKKIHNKEDKDSKIKFRKITMYIDLLSEQGIAIGEPYVKHLDKEIWELRPLRDRILFAYIEDNKIILLSIFMKQTQKTPKYEIERAKKLLKDYRRRSDKNE